ncbi:EAL domain-containing protein [Limnospira fusiformis]|uniref:EAL domain-containing protein n=1 Tax=Limnospira fusiformis TaxID=54297 RepID=UPI002AA105B9|nr:EAL domain-containing protein [Limnospira fusiformis LS22]
MRRSATLKNGLSGQSKVICLPGGDLDGCGDRLHQINRLKKALSEQQLGLYTQEAIPLNSGGSKRYCEILIRFIDESDKVLPASWFLPIAERYGLAEKIDRWVIETVLDLLSETTPENREKYRFAINISSRTLYDYRQWRKLEREILKRDLTPDLFCWEIAESTILANPQKAADAIANLQIQGYYVTVDQVGGRYSSLDYLNYVTVDYLKIADDLVKDIAQDLGDRSIVQIIQLVAQSLAIETIANGVETSPAFETLRDLEIDYAQGYYLTQPHPLAAKFLG